MAARPRRLVLLRHGETAHNADGIWQGQLDTELSVRGLAQAAAAGNALARVEAVRIVSSDLARAARTAEIVGQALGIPLALDERFREVHAGAWQGLTAAQVSERDPELRAAILRGEDVKRGGDGESMRDVVDRVALGLEDLTADLGAGECAIICTHGAAARALASVLLGLESSEAWRIFAEFGNCHWAEFVEGSSGWRLAAWNISSGHDALVGESPP